MLENVRVEIDKTSKYPCGKCDGRPGVVGIYGHQNAGIFCQMAGDVTMRSEIVWGANRPDYYGHALECHAVTNLRLEGFRGQAAHPERDTDTLIATG